MLNKALLDPGSIAILGASNKTEKPGNRLVRSIVDGGYSGKVYPVNPKEKEIYDLKCYNSLEELPPVDLGVIALHPVDTVDAVKIMARDKGTRAFIIISAGFGETGTEGRKLEGRLKELAAEYQLSIIGPNCIGVINDSYKAIFVCSQPKVETGAVDYVTASGAFAVFLFELANKQGVRFGSVYSVGNSVSIGVEEVLQFWDENYVPGKSGRVKLVYAEQIRKPAMFFKHIHSLRQKGCYVVVLKPGDSDAGARAALSHTGSMAGDKEAIAHLIRKAGAIRCYNRDELVYLANILSQPLPKGKSFAIITHAGGPAVMLTDQLQQEGFSVPELDEASQQELHELLYPGSSAINPIDMMATGNREQLCGCIRLCDTLDYVDATLVIYGKTGLEDLFETYTAVHETVQTCKKPVYAVVPSISTGNDEIAHFVGLGNAAYFDEILLAKCLGKIYSMPKPFENRLYIPPDRKGGTTKILDQEAVAERLEASGIPQAPAFYIQAAQELRSLENASYPLVAKVLGVLHKTEHQGVILNIGSFKELEEAYKQLMAIEGASGIMVQPMIEGTEIFLGALRHDKIGWSVHAGPGGIFIELLNDRAATLAPVNFEEAMDLLSGLKTQKLFEGFRNLPAVDKKAFAEILVSFSQLFEKYPDISEIDINPLMADGNQIVAVDTRIIINE